MDINSRNLGQQEEDLDKKKFRKRASMSRSNTHLLKHNKLINICGIAPMLIKLMWNRTYDN